jgi:drug/metabolite transporter (DMT)-like permease
MAKNNNIRLGIIMLLAATLAWGGQFSVAKPILAVIDPFYMTLIRYSIAAPIFMIMLLYFEGKSAFKFEGRFGELLFLGTLGFAGFNLLAFSGLTHASPEHGAVILALMPMITFLLTWVLKGLRPNSFTFVTILCAFFGVFLVITGGNLMQAFSGGEAEWDLLFLFGAFFWVCYTMGAQRFPSWSSLKYTVITCCLGTVSIGFITLVLTLNGTVHIPSINNIMLVDWRLAYMILIAALVAVLSWNVGIKLLGAVNGVLFINFVPITAFAIGVVQGRSFSSAEVIGALLVIGALIANNLYLRYK